MQKNGKEAPRVFGLGLSRTGTMSLGKALDLLGIRTVHYPHDRTTLRELRTGNYELSILKEYRGLVDIVASPYYRQFDEVYPGSKFVLTVRDRHSWLRSLRAHWSRMTRFWDGDEQFKRFTQFICTRVYGGWEFNEERMLRAYDHHLREVREFFAGRPRDLLILDICGGEGWEKLCPFLDLPAPAAPFAHFNKGSGKDRRPSCEDQVARAATELARVIPPDDTFIFVDEAETSGRFPLRGNAVPFLERAGRYRGRPHDGETAIRELERLRSKEAKFIVFLSSSFWWLDHYATFGRYLRANFRCILENECVLVFDLRR